MRSFVRAVLRAVPLSAVIALAVQTPAPVAAGAFYVDPCLQSVLCRGLVEHFSFDDTNDSPRWGAFGTQLDEPGGVDVPGITTGGFSTAVSFAGTTSSFLWKSFAPGPSGYWTIAFWFNPQAIGTNGTKRSIISWDAAGTGGTNGNDRGPDVYLESNGTNLRLCLSVVAVESDTATSICSAYTLTTSVWYFGVVGQSNFFDGKNQILVSLNGAAPTTTATSYYTRTGMGHVRVGGRPVNGAGSGALSGVNLSTGDQPYQGYLNDLDIYARALSPAEITLLYNGGVERPYPYVTE
jgi:hypothetical protein